MPRWGSPRGLLSCSQDRRQAGKVDPQQTAESLALVAARRREMVRAQGACRQSAGGEALENGTGVRASVQSVSALTTMRQLAWRGCYELMAGRLKRPEWAFMNYGFAADPTERAALRLEPSDEPDRLCIQLYDHVVGATELTGRDVLEVGSGRGGGCFLPIPIPSSEIDDRDGPRTTSGRAEPTTPARPWTSVRPGRRPGHALS